MDKMDKRIFAFAALAFLLALSSRVEARHDDEDDDRDDRGRERTIVCESKDERATYCETHTWGRVRLNRQLSKTRCEEYDTWGADDDGAGVWVRNGCRGEFVVRERRGWGHWHDRDRDRDRDYDRGDVSRLRCASKDWGYEHCGARGRVRDARMVRQISKTRCVQNDNWGADRDGIWVDRGCEAEFEVR